MLRTLSRTLAALLLLCSTASATEAGAKTVIADYERQLAAWEQSVKDAQSQRERAALWEKRPSSEQFGVDLVRQMDGGWDQEWILDAAIPLFTYAPQFSTQVLKGAKTRTPLNAVREAAQNFHALSPKLGPLALAITIDNGPNTRKFLETLEESHPNNEVQGQAAMALALASRDLGEGGDVATFKKRRMELVRKAIIESADKPYGDSTIGEIAERFLFAVTNLEKGMEAPDLLGRDVSGEAMRLKDFRGKPVMLIFWHAGMQNAEGAAKFIQKVETNLGPKGLQVLGVARESPESLRRLVKDGDVTWRNWVDPKGKITNLYQVEYFPSAWIIDAKGIIQYRGDAGPFAELTAQALLQ